MPFGRRTSWPAAPRSAWQRREDENRAVPYRGIHGGCVNRRPADLTLDAATGILSGTPKAVSTKTSYKFTVTDSATPSASSSADLTLEIK